MAEKTEKTKKKPRKSIPAPPTPENISRVRKECIVIKIAPVGKIREMFNCSWQDACIWRYEALKKEVAEKK